MLFCPGTPNAQSAVVMVSGLRRRGHGLKSHLKAGNRTCEVYKTIFTIYSGCQDKK